MISRLGASRMSSVLGLNVRPSTPIVLPPRSSPSASITLPAIAVLRRSLALTVASTSVSGRPASAAVRTRASVSFGKQEPPKPGPACRNFDPMRLSSPMPRATCCTSASTASHRSAISLMKVIFIAR